MPTIYMIFYEFALRYILWVSILREVVSSLVRLDSSFYKVVLP